MLGRVGYICVRIVSLSWEDCISITLNLVGRWEEGRKGGGIGGLGKGCNDMCDAREWMGDILCNYG